MLIASTARILTRVILGEGCRVGEFCLLGEWPDPGAEDKPELRLGDGAVVRSHTVIYGGVVAGRSLQTGHGALIRQNCRLGDDVSVGSHAVVEHDVVVGDRVRIHSGAFVPEFSRLEDDCWIGPQVTLTNAPHPRCVNLPNCLAGVTVGRGAKIGAGVILMPGVVIGEGALVGAGAVVTKDVEPGAVVTGVPARLVGRIEDLICPWDGVTHPYGSRDKETD